jgi:NTP pyrophosphatase (non-canonical NTP hydrolase)
MEIKTFQKQIEDIYFKKDSNRGIDRTFLWFAEECGELAEAVRKRDKSEFENEAADVLAWLATLSSIVGVDLQSAAVKKYGSGCPRCKSIPCACEEKK